MVVVIHIQLYIIQENKKIEDIETDNEPNYTYQVINE